MPCPSARVSFPLAFCLHGNGIPELCSYSSPAGLRSQGLGRPGPLALGQPAVRKYLKNHIRTLKTCAVQLHWSLPFARLFQRK